MSHFSKRYFFCLVVSLLCFLAPARAQDNFQAVDRLALQVQPGPDASIAQLAGALTRSLRSEREKVRAIYTWVAHNIVYNDTIVSKNWLGKPENAEKQRAEYVLRARSAVCEGFANLFQALCTEAGIRASFVSGDIKDESGNVPDIGHAWNAVFVDDAWWLCDPTWGSGYIDPVTDQFQQQFNDRFFLVAPADFLTEHFPDDPMWQCGENPVTASVFRSSGPEDIISRFRETPDEPFAYRDSIDAWFELDSLQRVLGASRRIIRFNPENDYALYRLGSYFYNLGYRQYFELSNELIETMYEEGDFLPDSTRILHLIEQAESNQLRSWNYYRYVQRDPVKSFINELPTPAEQAGSFEYLRGMYRLWLVHHLGEQIPRDNTRPNARIIRLIQYHGRAGQYHFEKALNTLDGNDKMNWSVWHNNKSLLHYELAHHNSNYYAAWENLGEKELRNNLAGLDAVEADLQAMKSAMETALQKGATMKGAFVLDEYPELLSQLFCDRGAVHMALQNARYQTDIEQPENITLKKAAAMTADFETCNDYFNRALALTDKVKAGERHQQLKKSIASYQGYLLSLIGDFHLNAAQNAHNNAGTQQQLQQLLPSIRNATDKARQYYTQANKVISRSGAPPQTQKQIAERLQSVRQMEDFLRKNYGE